MSDYKVGVEIAMAGNVEAFLGVMAKKLFGVHGQVKEIGKDLGNWGKLIGGAGLAVGGIEVLKFMDHIAKAGGELQRQANNFQAAGNSIQDTAAAITGAFAAIQKAPGVDAVEAMKHYREIAGATQDNAGSIAVLPDVLKASMVIKAATGSDDESQMQRVAKMIELRQGAIDHATHKIIPDRFVKELDVATKALQVGQGLISANDLQMLTKQAGPMAKGMDPMKFWSIYLASLEDMGGARTGTAMTAVARQVLGGTMTGPVKDEWRDIGMLGPMGQGWHNNAKGHTVIDDPKKAIRGYSTFQDDGFQAFIDKFVKPTFEKAGYKDDKSQNAELYRFGSTETARRLYSMYMTGGEQVDMERKKLGQAQGIDAFDKIYKQGDYEQSVKAFTDAWKSLEEALGGPGGKAMAKVLNGMADQLNSFAAMANAHPEIVSAGTYFTAAAAGIAALVGPIIALQAALKIGKWASGPTGVDPTGGASLIGPNMPKFSAGKFLKSGAKGGIIGGLLEYFGESAIDAGTDYFKTSPYPKGYDPKHERDMGIGDRLKQIWHELPSIIGPAHAEAVTKVGAQMNTSVKALPGQVDPAISAAFSQIGAALASAISGLSGAAAAAGGAIKKVELHVDGKKMASVVEKHFAMNNRAVDSASGHDGRSAWAHPEVANG